jgi:hypothetical protein
VAHGQRDSRIRARGTAGQVLRLGERREALVEHLPLPPQRDGAQHHANEDDSRAQEAFTYLCLPDSTNAAQVQLMFGGETQLTTG